MLVRGLVGIAMAAAAGGAQASSDRRGSCELTAVPLCGAARNASMRACAGCLTSHGVELIGAGCTNTILIDWCHRTCASGCANCSGALAGYCGHQFAHGKPLPTCGECVLSHAAELVAAKCSDRTMAGFCPGGQAPHPRPSPAPKPRPAPLAPPHGNLTGRKHLRWYAGSPTRLEPLLLGTNPERLLNTSHPLAEITGAV
jgi:hypothetical protein